MEEVMEQWSGGRNTQHNWTGRGFLNPPARPSVSFGKSFQHLYIHSNCLQSSCSTCCHRVLNTPGQRINGTLSILITSRESLWQRHLYKRKSHLYKRIIHRLPFPISCSNSLFYSVYKPSVMKVSKFWMLENHWYWTWVQIGPVCSITVHSSTPGYVSVTIALYVRILLPLGQICSGVWWSDRPKVVVIWLQGMKKKNKIAFWDDIYPEHYTFEKECT